MVLPLKYAAAAAVADVVAVDPELVLDVLDEVVLPDPHAANSIPAAATPIPITETLLRSLILLRLIVFIFSYRFLFKVYVNYKFLTNFADPHNTPPIDGQRPYLGNPGLPHLYHPMKGKVE